MFNYYSLEFSSNPRFIRARKVVGGKSYELFNLDTISFNQDTWHNVKVESKRDVHTIYFGEEEENTEEKYDKIQRLIKFVDQDFSRGLSGFMTNDNNFFLVDNISFEPLGCQTPEDEPPAVIIPPLCSRFRESYWGTSKLSWKVQDPDDSEFAPGTWYFQ